MASTRLQGLVLPLAAALALIAAGSAQAGPTVPDHAVIVCDSAGFYADYWVQNGWFC
ncbi:hypothetical protein [Streptomyces sp. NPDC060198]|uniref:hypothetical protein n=1 Tax=Streptomyces sp. NPDC060198 TaxID=3347070 RepID=UPI00365D37B9